jgi:hypothetical protein
MLLSHIEDSTQHCILTLRMNLIMHSIWSSILLIGLVARTALAQVKGTAPGFAAGTTGGGSATPQYPSSLTE